MSHTSTLRPVGRSLRPLLFVLILLPGAAYWLSFQHTEQPLRDRIEMKKSGGKNESHANQRARDQASEKYQKIKEELGKLEEKPNKSKEDVELRKNCVKRSNIGERKKIGMARIILKNIKATDMTYTFILYFRGGTYIEQVAASDVIAAAHAWAEKTANNPEVEHLDRAAFLKVFYYDIPEFPPIPINGRPNVWHLYFLMGQYELDIHIIKTSEYPEPMSAETALKARVTN